MPQVASAGPAKAVAKGPGTHILLWRLANYQGADLIDRAAYFTTQVQPPGLSQPTSGKEGAAQAETDTAEAAINALHGLI